MSLPPRYELRLCTASLARSSTDVLRDQLMVGLRSEPIRKRIMERDGISFADALKLAADLERITREAKLGATAEGSVSQVKASSQASNQRGCRGACWSCGATGHRRADCKYMLNGFKCNECGEAGHKAMVCPRRSKGASSFCNTAPQEHTNKKGQRLNATQVDADVDNNVATINTIQVAEQLNAASYTVAPVQHDGASKQFNLKVSVNGVPVTMALDTCADTSIASSAFWRQLGEPALSSAPTIRAYGGAEVPALGQCVVDVVYECHH